VVDCECIVFSLDVWLIVFLILLTQLYLFEIFQEMLISPALLDFLEQAIEPIPKIQLVSLKGHRNGKVKGHKPQELVMSSC